MYPSLDMGLVGVLLVAISLNGATMNEVMKPALAEEMPDVGASLAAVSSSATRRICEHGQSVAQAISGWSTEASQFLSHRAARNAETLRSLTKCQNFFDVCSMQLQWLRDASDDYLMQTNKLAQLQIGLITDSFKSVPELFARTEKEGGSPTMRGTMRPTT
jgi:hypothetical protein